MKYTLLELTQAVLSSMDSDEINSIDDTVEAQQVVEVIKTVYDDIVSRSDLPIHKILFNLDASGDGTKPVLMTKPSVIDRVLWIRYNTILDGDTDPVWTDMKYIPPEDFIMRSQSLNLSETNVDSMTLAMETFSTPIYYYNDVAPSFYTSFNDETVIFDAYDSEVDSTLQASKTLCYGTKHSEFLKIDSFTPELQPQQFALLLNEAKSLAWSELKQTVHAKAEQSAKRNWVNVSKKRQSIPSGTFGSGAHPFDQLKNYGRK